MAAIAGVVLHAPTAARADDVTLRLDTPAYIAAEGERWYQMIGAAATWRRAPVEAELAADVWLNACVSGLTYTARGGVAPALVETPGWSVRVPLLAGASVSPLDGGGCDQNPDKLYYAVSSATGFEAIRWGPRKGFSLRALGFIGEQSFPLGLLSSNPYREWRAFYGFTISLGVSLPVWPAHRRELRKQARSP